MNITPKPISFSDTIDKSRDVSGFSKWGQSSRTVSFIMFMLGLFTIPVEVLLRRDFGQRWLTVVNFYAGLFLLLLFATLQYIVAAFSRFISWIGSLINPFHIAQEPSLTDRVMNKSMLFILVAYLLMGSYHLFKIWWRNRTDAALHSFDDGTSRTMPVSGYLIRVLNTLAVPFVHLYRLLLPSEQRLVLSMPELINDHRAFTNTVFEPLLLFMLAFCFHGIVSLWLFISAIALAIHANWKETARQTKILDFRDSMIEAKTMMQLKEETAGGKAVSRLNRKTDIDVKRKTDLNMRNDVRLTIQHPDLMSIIEDMHSDKSHLGN